MGPFDTILRYKYRLSIAIFGGGMAVGSFMTNYVGAAVFFLIVGMVGAVTLALELRK